MEGAREVMGMRKRGRVPLPRSTPARAKQAAATPPRLQAILTQCDQCKLEQVNSNAQNS